MKQLLILFFVGFSTILIAQEIDYNTEERYLLEGYDVVSYFTEIEPLIGKEEFQATYHNVKFKFSSEKNRNIFLENPTKYIPQYGGYCAYAIAKKKIKMEVDPEEYEIRDGKLYLFYNSWFSSKLTAWKKGNTKKLQTRGDTNWEHLKHKKTK